MKRTIIKNLNHIFCVSLGFLTLILFAIPYLVSFVKLQYLDQTISGSNNINGYSIMNMWDGDYSCIISSILQILILTLAIVMIIWGVLCFLKSINMFEKFPNKIFSVKTSTISEILIYIYSGLNIILLTFMIILTVKNSQSFEGITSGVRFSAGIFLTLIASILSVISLKLLQKKYANTDILDEYICSKCGKKSKSGDLFCNKCGGQIIKSPEFTNSPTPNDDNIINNKER